MKKLLMLLIAIALMMPVFTEGSQETGTEEQYPEENVTVIVPYNAGGGSDTITRLIDNYLEEYLGKNLNFVYRAGAGGAVGISELAKSKADAYTIAASNLPHIALQSLLGSGDFDTDDFDFICQMAVTYPIFVTPKNSPYKDLASFIAAAKKSPGSLTIGLPGAAGNTLIGFGQFMDEADIDCTLINYSGGSDMLAAVLGSQIDAAFSAINMTMSNIDDMNLLAVAFTERDEKIPDVPTFSELGFKVSCPTSRIYLAPAGLPGERLQILEDAFRKVYDNPSYAEAAAKAAFISNWMGHDELEAFVDDLRPQAAKYIEKYYSK
jgi:putative tricarboxylic transport membrane protein